MHLGIVIIEAFDAMIVTPPSPDWASMFSMCFLEEFTNYDLLIIPGDGNNNVTPHDTYDDEMNMVGIGRILDAAPYGPHSDFDLFRVSILETDKVTLYDAFIDKVDMMGIGHILDAAPREPCYDLDLFEASMLELDDDGSIPNVVSFEFTYVEGASDYVDPHLSFDSMSRFVTL